MMFIIILEQGFDVFIYTMTALVGCCFVVVVVVVVFVVVFFCFFYMTLFNPHKVSYGSGLVKMIFKEGAGF